jgi:hypothetical protein
MMRSACSRTPPEAAPLCVSVQGGEALACRHGRDLPRPLLDERSGEAKSEEQRRRPREPFVVVLEVRRLRPSRRLLARVEPFEEVERFQASAVRLGFSAIASRNARRLAVSIAFLHLAETPLDFLGERRPREPRRPFGARVRRHAVAVEPFRKSPRGPEAKVEQSSRVASSRRKAALGEVVVEFDRVRRFQDALGDLSRARLQRATVSREDTVLRGEEVARLGRCKGLRVPVRVADHASIVPGASDFPSAFQNGRLAASFGNGEHRKGAVSSAFAKPSDGLEPSTPSLPWRCSTH